MSAWIVSKKHIDYMVTAMVAHGLSTRAGADDLGRLLWKENLKSVAYRYPDDGDGDRPGPNDFRDGDVDAYVYEETPLLKGGALAKTLACYAYQSCEHPEWEDSLAASLVKQLRKQLGNVPYDDDDATPWGW